MKEVASLEIQLEQVDVKPRSKLSQRPKDTVMRDQTHSLSNIHPGRVKTVEKSKVLSTCMLIKLLLQTKNLTHDNMGQLIFSEGNEDDQISIADLSGRFENLGINPSKAMLMARFLIEPPSQGEVVYNEKAVSTQGEILIEFKKTIGHYRLYKSEGYEIEDDTNYVSEEYMKKVVVESFGRSKDALEESLQSEALDGVLSL